MTDITISCLKRFGQFVKNDFFLLTLGLLKIGHNSTISIENVCQLSLSFVL